VASSAASAASDRCPAANAAATPAAAMQAVSETNLTGGLFHADE
jgi:hypothetical protein